MTKPTIAIIGASCDRRKFGNKAVRAYAARGYQVFPVNRRETSIEGHKVFPSVKDVPLAHLNRVSLYVPPETGLLLLPDLAGKTIDELWLNPGSEAPELVAHARSLGWNVVLGCSIVDIGVDPAELE